MRILFLGTREMGHKGLEAIINEGFEVIGIVTGDYDITGVVKPREILNSVQIRFGLRPGEEILKLKSKIHILKNEIFELENKLEKKYNHDK